MSMGRNKERREAWKAANREKILAYHSEYNRRYYQAHKEELLYKKKCRACGVTPAIEPIAIPHPKRTYIAPQVKVRLQTESEQLINNLQSNVQQLHTDITNKVAEFEKLFENWE